jgi:hypothetical protein
MDLQQLMNDAGIDLGPTPNRPYPGTIWRHRKHNPPEHWHEYMVIGVNLAGPSDEDAGQIFTCRDSETLEWWDVAGNSRGMWLYQSNSGLGHTIWRNVPTVVYKSTADNLALPWVRPLSEFLDGRFTEVK